MPTVAEPFADEPVESEICEFVMPVEPADDQLSLFDDCASAPVAPSVPNRNVVATAPVQAAACRVRPKKEQAPVDKKTDGKACTKFEQSLNKACTKNDKTASPDEFAAALSRLSNALDNKRAPAPDARALPMKQENNINKSINYESSMDKTYETLIFPRLTGSTVEKRDESLYNYYLADVKKRFPAWHKLIFNPSTKRNGNCKWAVETIAAMMAWGMPESVYWDTVDYCFGSNANTSAKSPALAFLHIVKNLKSQYRWKADWNV